MGQQIDGQTANSGQQIAQNASAAAEKAKTAAADAVDKQLAQIKQADLQQKIAKSISDAAANANQAMNSALSAMLQPIQDVIQQFKPIPGKLRKLVDVDGEKNGMYDNLDKMRMMANYFQEKNLVSSEVPITLSDYRADPSQYENLLAIEYQKNNVTEDDCLSSGYTKVVWECKPEYMQKLLECFQPPQDRDIVGKQMEKVIGTVIKAAWQTVQTPVKTVASIANIGPIPGMVQSVVDSVDAIVKIAAEPIPEKTLDAMLAQKTHAQEQGKIAAQRAKVPDPGAAAGDESRLEKAMSAAGDAISQAYTGAVAGIQESFANFEAPVIPDDIKETIDDFKDAIIMVKNNISNIYTIVLLKMMNAVFDCFNQIIGIIGFPTIPDPLGKIPQIMSDAEKIMTFINGLPMSLIQCLTAIIKRKMKAVMVAQTPAPPLPLPEKVPVPPTSEDVVRPETSWEDVRASLIEDYGFANADADEIISRIQAFFDGSGGKVSVITGKRTVVYKENNFDCLPEFSQITRINMTPLYCKSTWIPGNLEKIKQAGEGYVYHLRPPVKLAESGWGGQFCYWTADGKRVVFNYDNDWSTFKDYASSLNGY